MDAHTFELIRLGLEMALTALGALLFWVIRDASNSIKELNVKMAVICERVDSHEKRIDRLEQP